MKYFEVEFSVNPYSEEACDVLSSLLADVGFETFVPKAEGLEAYIQQAFYDEESVRQLTKDFPLPHFNISFITREAPDEDWNQRWEEEGFEPIVIDSLVGIHDTRHTCPSPCTYDITINPRMAFGTGTHPTTRQILRQLCSMDMQDKSIVDAGCGTGVLGFLCSMRGAKDVFSYDIDSWSVENTKINADLNGITNIRVQEGDASVLSSSPMFDLLIANINRNILLQDMPRFAKVLKPKGQLLLSGFYESDIPLLLQKGEELGLSLEKETCEEGWAMLFLRKCEQTDFNCPR